MAVEKLKRKQFPQRPVPQAEAEAYFVAHRDRFPRVPGEIRLQVIQLPPAPDSAAVTAGYAKIQAIRKRVTSGGEKFAKVAAEVSEDPGSANAGGDLGFFPRGRLERNVETAAFTQKLDEVGPPVRSLYGWHLVQALERDTLKSAAGRDSLGPDGKPELEAHARHILVRVTPGESDIARARTLAEHVRDEARKGTPFGTLVRRYSKYDGPSDPEGDVGFVSLANLQGPIRAGLDSLEIGQVSDVLTNQTGFNVFRVVDRHPERDYTVEEIRAELPEAVAQVQYREKLEAWLKTLRAKAQIEYRNL
jgi:parvulin-like peptidyl-prolyl isomerase